MNRLLLVNLGGPRNINEIEKFLTDLFTDPYIFDIPLPKFLQQVLGKVIAKRRTLKVKHAYESLNYGGGSPLVAETIKQAKKLEEKLNLISQEKWQVEVFMTCGFPNIRDRKFELEELGRNIFVLPLYPQYSRSTTLSTLKIVQNIIKVCPVSRNPVSCIGESCASLCQNPNFETQGWINPFYKNEEFIEASVSLIIDFYEGKLDKKQFIQLEEPPQEDWKKVPILFSAHGIPMRLVKKGDPYPDQVKETQHLIETSLRKYGFEGETFLSYQSKVGPARWTTPSTIEMLSLLGKKGIQSISIYPISFVSDHLETLEEIGNQLKSHALLSGIKNYYRIPALGTYRKFIDCLAKLVLQNFQIVKNISNF